MKDSLGDRIKNNYENITRYHLPRRTYTIIRLDGKAFHTYTKGLKRPFDLDLAQDMQATTVYLCGNIMGAVLGFVESDEISLLLTDFSKNETEAYFDGNIQKMCSISSSMATAVFNNFRNMRDITKLAMFDARVFTIPDSTEVENYFIWRQNDATRNAIQMVAQSLYSHKELHKKNGNEKQQMLKLKTH